MNKYKSKIIEENGLTVYDDYRYCLSKYIDWIREQIAKNGFIRVRRSEFIKALSKELSSIGYKKLSKLTYQEIIRVILFDEGIFVQLGIIYDGYVTFLLRNKRSGDKLTYTLWDARMSMKSRRSIM